MRVYCAVRTVWTVASVATATVTPLAASSNSDDAPDAGVDPRFVVLGIDGKVVPDADPGLYLPKKLPRVFIEHLGELRAFPSHPELGRIERFALGGRRELNVLQQSPQRVNNRHGDFLAQVVAPTVQVGSPITGAAIGMAFEGADAVECCVLLSKEQDEDEFSGPIDFHVSDNRAPVLVYSPTDHGFCVGTYSWTYTRSSSRRPSSWTAKCRRSRAPLSSPSWCVPT